MRITLNTAALAIFLATSGCAVDHQLKTVHTFQKDDQLLTCADLEREITGLEADIAQLNSRTEQMADLQSWRPAGQTSSAAEGLLMWAKKMAATDGNKAAGSAASRQARRDVLLQRYYGLKCALRSAAS